MSAEFIHLGLDAVAKTTLLLVAAGSLNAALLRASAATRHALWAAVLTGCLTLPVASALIPPLAIPILPGWLVTDSREDGARDARPTRIWAEAAPAAELAPGTASAFDPATAAEPDPLAAPSGVESSGESPSDAADELAIRAPIGRADAGGVRWAGLVLGIWLAGAFALSLWSVSGILGLATVARGALPLDGDPSWDRLLRFEREGAGIRRPVRLLSSPRAAMPMSWGIAFPVVLLPADASEWDEARKRIVLRHELAHVARRDALTQLIGSVACSVYWFHPGVWWAARSLAREREKACDDRVILSGTAGEEYASELLALARSIRGDKRTITVSFALARSSELEDRVMAVLNQGLPRAGSPGVRLALVATMLGVGLTLAATRLVAAGSMRATTEAAGPATSESADPASAVTAESAAAGLPPQIAPTDALAVSGLADSAPVADTRASAALPTFELVGEYWCSTCTGAPSFGTGAIVAAGTGNSFGVLTISEPNVTVWDLSTGTTSQFSVMQRTEGRIANATGLVILPDAVIVAGENRPNRAAEKFTLDGRHLGNVPYAPLGPDTQAGISWYEASPSGKWVLHRQIDHYGQFGRDGSSYIMVRTNVATGESETLDVPPSLYIDDPTLSSNTPAGASAAISDDGTVAVGYGEVGYRLMLIPVSGPRLEGGRSIAKKPLTQEQIDRIRNPGPRPAINPALPADMQARFDSARAAREPVIPDGIAHFTSGALQFDSKGRLWVNTSRGTYGVNSVIDVFSPTLAYLGEVTLEGSISYHWDFGPQLLVTRMGSTKGTSVKVWRIREP